MNERVSAMGGQVKQAFGKIGEAWNGQEPARKKRILTIAAALLVLAVGLVIVINIVSGRYVVLYEDMGQDESVRAKGVLETAGVPSRINSDGQLEVPSKNINQAMGQLAIAGIPSTTLDYSIMDAAGGLTTTEYEKRKAWVQQQQNRLQDTIKTLTGVQNAIVQLNINTESNRMWDTAAARPTASITVHMQQGYMLGAGQVAGIRHLVATGVGIDPMDVTIIDQMGNLLAGAGEEYNASSVTQNFLERMNLEAEVEQRLSAKVANLLSLLYPDEDQWSISCTATLNFDAMVTEIKEYSPLEGTIHGVVDQEELSAIMGLGQLAQGVVGETDNTDIPIYVDENGDGNIDAVDYQRYRDYAVSYVLKQIEKTSPELASASIAVIIDDTVDAETLQSLRTLISQATGIPVENVTVQNFLTTPAEIVTPPSFLDNLLKDIPPIFIYIALGVVALLIVLLILLIIMRRKAKKKKLALAAVADEEERLEAERIQQEIEERKKQLKEAAIGEHGEDAISNEVREFARNNPEITANLLRNWLKEGE